ncbi:hypothetical protein LR48_Vigan04g031100 [Vigna angularis]|uniref:Uncharacterized protein n=1 Tax=Phaseolus angularis TaxID=3914 RepID=A0A0L9UBI2_PHAAN|nr:hypothetical protein LR48_Vigan04g031100 [Vigna angularis]
MAAKRVKLPLFDETDPVGWNTRAETYFEVQGSTQEMKLRLAKLKRELIGRYGGCQTENPY